MRTEQEILHAIKKLEKCYSDCNDEKFKLILKSFTSALKWVLEVE